jgi:L-asparagine transporter-like permease
MQGDAGFEHIIERERGLRQRLSAARMAMIAIGGAIGTGLFLGSGFAISLAGPGVLLSYGIGALIALLLMGCLAEMSIAHPTSGSFGAYAEYYLGPLAGFLVRYAYWTGVVLAVGTEVTAVALYMRYWFPGVPGWIWIMSFSAALILINARSVSLFGAVEYWFSATKVLAIVVFIALASFLLLRGPAQGASGTQPGFGNYTAHGGFLPHGWWGAWVAVIVAVFSYLSIEMIAVAAGEAKDPRRAIRVAFRSTVLRLVLFYLLTLALILALVPWSAAGIDESPFVKVMRAFNVPAAPGLVNLVILIAALSAMNSQLYITTRMMFSLARAGYAPARFGRLNARGVPLQALLLSSLGITAATVLSVVSPERAYLLMVSISAFGAMFTWLMIFVTHYFFRRVRQVQSEAFRMVGYPATTILGGALMCAVLVTTAFTGTFRLTLVFGAPFLGLLCVLYRWRSRRPASSAPAQALLDDSKESVRAITAPPGAE